MTDLAEKMALLSRANERESGKTLSIVLKVSERCNIACTYCYFFFSTDQSYKDHPAVLPVERADATLDFIERTLRAEKFNRLNFVFHGGEPLMAPLDTLQRLIDRLNGFVTNGYINHVSFAMQTNGLLLDQRRIAFITKNKIGVGVSLDGDRDFNDKYRVDHKGRGTYDRAIAGWKRLANAEIGGRKYGPPGLLSVAHPDRDGASVFNHFAHELGCKNFNFLLPDYTYDDEIIDDEYVQGIERFLKGVFWAWVKKNDPRIRVRFIDEIVFPLINDHAAEINLQTKVDYFELLSISSDGTLAPEDTIKLIGEEYQNLGNVDDFETVKEVHKHQIYNQLSDSFRKPPKKCLACDWYGNCGGDKTINRKSHVNGLDNPSIYCNALKGVRLDIASWLVANGIEVDKITERLKLYKAHKLRFMTE